MTERKRIPTSFRPLLLLEALGAAGRPMSAAELGREVGLGRQTTHRLCQMLEAEGFLTRHGQTRRFVPARRMRNAAAGLLFASRAHVARHQVLTDVAAQVRETVNFVIPQASGMHYLDRVETDWPFRIQFPVGSNVPFHCTASGKTFMASMPPAERRAFVGALRLDPFTPKTLADRERLLADLELTRSRGYAIDDEEFIEGLVAIAVPVTDPENRFVAALAFHGPLTRLTLDKAIEQKDVLLEGARRLREVLFGE